MPGRIRIVQRARKRVTDLAGNTKSTAVFIRDEDRFDFPAVSEANPTGSSRRSTRLIPISSALRTAVRRGRRSSADSWRRQPGEAHHGDFAIGMIDTRIGAAIGARSKVARLSGETAAKQGGRRLRHDRDVGHPEVTAEDYALVQRIVDEGERFHSQAATHVLGFLGVGDAVWKVTIKRTLDRSATYMQSLHRAEPRKIVAARRNLEPVTSGG